MNQSNDDILIALMAECSDQIMQGATLASCLAQHPAQAVALEPLLQTVVQVRRFRPVPERSAALAAQSRAEFIAAVRQLTPSPAASPAGPASWGQRLGTWWQDWLAGFIGASRGWSRPRAMPAGLAFALLAVILAGVLATGAISASARALPGDLLYPLKTTTENVRVLITRNPVERAELLEEFADRRIDEALTIVRIGRPVTNLTLEGIIEEIDGATWVVSGQTVTLTDETRIEGEPVIGAQVQGRMDAPGDGQLQVTYARIAPPAIPFAPTARPTAAPTPTLTATPSQGAAGLVLPTQAYGEPPEAPSPTPTATSSITPTSTRTRAPTKTPRPTRQATPTPIASLTPPRAEINQTFYGWVKGISGNRWTIDSITVETDGNTQYLNTPGLGWEVQANVLVRSDGSYLARQIIGLREPAAPVEPLEFTGTITQTEGDWWTIGPYRVRVDQDTRREGDPQIGDRVHVNAERRSGGEIHALQITVLLYVERQFEGVVSAAGSDAIVVDGYTLIIDGATQIIGQPVVGSTVQVAAWEMPDGQLVARIIMVMEPGPTANATPTATGTLSPADISTPTPTATATSAP